MPDTVASVASILGDYGLVWFVFAVLQGALPGKKRRTALRALFFTGLVSPIVNALLKAAVGRLRPEGHDSQRIVRVPRTASFPSGHALAAWCAARLLSEDEALAPLYYGAAVVISLSRVHVRLHHATDVVGGAILGFSLGELGRILLPVS